MIDVYNYHIFIVEDGGKTRNQGKIYSESKSSQEPHQNTHLKQFSLKPRMPSRTTTDNDLEGAFPADAVLFSSNHDGESRTNTREAEPTGVELEIEVDYLSSCNIFYVS